MVIVNGAVTTKDVLPPLLATYPDALEPHHDPDYSGNNGTPNTFSYSRVLIRQLTTEWVDKDGKELKTPITDTDINQQVLFLIMCLTTIIQIMKEM